MCCFLFNWMFRLDWCRLLCTFLTRKNYLIKQQPDSPRFKGETGFVQGWHCTVWSGNRLCIVLHRPVKPPGEISGNIGTQPTRGCLFQLQKKFKQPVWQLSSGWLLSISDLCLAFLDCWVEYVNRVLRVVETREVHVCGHVYSFTRAISNEVATPIRYKRHRKVENI